MRTRAILLIILLIPLTSFSQQNIAWQKSLGGSENDNARTILQTPDGGYIVAGNSASNDGDVTGNHGFSDCWVVKLDASGVIEWQKSLGGSSWEAVNSIRQTLDGGFIIAGYSYSSDGDATSNHGLSDYWVVKLTVIGEIEWQNSLGGSGYDEAESIQQTADGGYIVAGFSDSTNGDVTGNLGDDDYWIVKLTSTGTIEWQNSLGGSESDVAQSIQRTTDGGYIIAGYSYSNDGDVTGNHGNFDYWLVKLSVTGSIEWQKSLGGSSWDFASSIKQTTDGGYIVAGKSHSDDGDVSGNHGGNDYWIVKLTVGGNIQWQKSLGGTNTDFANFIQQTSHGGYIIAGASISNDGHVTGNHGGYDYWVIKLTATGDLEFQKSLGGSDFDIANCIQETLDGGIIIAGQSASKDGDVTGNHGDHDFWIVKLGHGLGVNNNELANSVLLHPNPNTSHFSLSFSEEIEVTKVEVVDTLGKLIYSETNMPSENIKIDHNFPAGVYFVNVLTKDSEATLKMIVD